MADELPPPPPDLGRGAVPPPLPGPQRDVEPRGEVNKLAVVSLGTGILAFFVLPVVLACLAFLWGVAAIGQMSRHPDQTGRDYAIAGMILGPSLGFVRLVIQTL